MDFLEPPSDLSVRKSNNDEGFEMFEKSRDMSGTPARVRMRAWWRQPQTSLDLYDICPATNPQ